MLTQPSPPRTTWLVISSSCPSMNRSILSRLRIKVLTTCLHSTATLLACSTTSKSLHHCSDRRLSATSRASGCKRSTRLNGASNSGIMTDQQKRCSFICLTINSRCRTRGPALGTSMRRLMSRNYSVKWKAHYSRNRPKNSDWLRFVLLKKLKYNNLLKS